MVVDRGVNTGLLFAAFMTLACGLDTHPNDAADGRQESGSPTSQDCSPQVLYEEFAALPNWMAASDEYVFWTDTRENALFRWSKRSSGAEIVSREIADGWGALAADSDAVYVARQDGMIHRIEGDDSRDIILSDVGGERANQLRIQGGHVYWLSSNGNLTGANAVVEVRRAGILAEGDSETLWRGNRASYGLAVHGDDVFVDEYTWPASGRNLDANGAITRIGISDGSRAELASGLLFPRVHAADAEFVYFSAQTPDAERLNQLWRAPTDGGPSELVFDGAGSGVDVGQMVAESGTIWWGQADDGEGRLRQVSMGAREILVTATVADTQHMLGLATDSDALYFSSRFSDDDVGPGMIWRVAKHCDRN
jgi:hypothetical protein